MSWQCWWIDEILKVSWVTLWSSFWVQSTGFTMCFSTSCIPELYHSVYFSVYFLTVLMNCIFHCISQLYRSTVFQNKQRSKWSWCKLVSAVNGLDNDALSGNTLIFLSQSAFNLQIQIQAIYWTLPPGSFFGSFFQWKIEKMKVMGPLKIWNKQNPIKLARTPFLASTSPPPPFALF